MGRSGLDIGATVRGVATGRALSGAALPCAVVGSDGDVQVFCGDCEQVLRDLVEPGSVSLIVTSPPYADQRRSTYGGIRPDEYVRWWLPRAEQMQQVRRSDGSLVVNIKERVVAGERHTYVIELIQAMRAQGWLWTEEYVWHKKNSYPGKWPNRFRDGWRGCFISL